MLQYKWKQISFEKENIVFIIQFFHFIPEDCDLI